MALNGLLSGLVDTKCYSYNSIEHYLFQVEEMAPILLIVDDLLWGSLSLDICERFDSIIKRLKLKTVFLGNGKDQKPMPHMAKVIEKPTELLDLKKQILELIRSNE